MSSSTTDRSLESLKKYYTICQQYFDPKIDLLVHGFVKDSNRHNPLTRNMDMYIIYYIVLWFKASSYLPPSYPSSYSEPASVLGSIKSIILTKGILEHNQQNKLIKTLQDFPKILELNDDYWKDQKEINKLYEPINDTTEIFVGMIYIDTIIQSLHTNQSIINDNFVQTKNW